MSIEPPTRPLIHRRDLIACTLGIVGTLCVTGLWLFEARAGILSGHDRYGYPFLLTAFAVSVTGQLLYPSWRGAMQLLMYLAASAYFLAALVLFVVFPDDYQVYTVANTLQWMPLLYVAAFAVLARRAAVAASLAVFVLSLLPTAAILLTAGPRYWSVELGSLFANAYVVHLVCMLALSIVPLLHERLELASHRALLMETAALTDGLTGVANRRGLDLRLAHLARRPGVQVGLILLDLDNFKSVNDRHGHLVGDSLLVYVAQRIREQLRDGDVLGRWGGEEFLVILTGATHVEVLQLAERIRLQVAGAPHPAAGPVHISGGVALWTTDTPLETALQCADRALYAAKNEGRNRVLAA